ncbi:phage tail tape measure protein [Corynebacterium pyruviciproducens]|uniref:phage tail tape measure protein n=1 Tax=Corynebacterium pyruviciproducens TaxID=598660 RepID=UPI00288AF2D4|nr:phage tail tape measure protein [Corynebacterium pyruviciproducens]
MAGGKIDILIEPDTKGFVPKMQRGLQGALATAGKMGAALGVAMGGAEIAKTVVKAGVEFDSQMNTMRAVSQATGEQIQAVAERARQLGNDTSLTATSAADAAAAMTELAKGGFSVDEAMSAAKGTLQLASAAQTDAATAATIQSQALQAFSLSADDASRVSDILAGAANASSAEIGDVAQALQQSGTVASQFGVSIEDTSTAIAMFANAGITGSDAGTLLKTSLLALTDQGKPAQQAIKELGLTVYDAQGKFVGLPALMGQLQKASESMTPEMYQAATTTLFGSDAARMAGVAAQQGAAGFDELKQAVTRQGQAAEVAAAQTEGMPGALERLQNTIDDVALGAYDAMKGTLVAGVNAATTAVGALGDASEVAFATVGKAAHIAADVFGPAAKGAMRMGSAMAGLEAPILSAVAALAAMRALNFSAHATAAGQAVRQFGDELIVQAKLATMAGEKVTLTSAALSTLEARSSAFHAVAEGARKASSPLMRFSQAQKHAADSAKAAAMATTNVWDFADRSFASAGHSMAATASKTSGLVVGAFGGMAGGAKKAVSGVVDALGGPWMLAIMGGAAVVGSLVGASQKASGVQEKLAEASRDSAAAQRELQSAVAGTTGALNEQGLTAAAKIAEGELAKLKTVGEEYSGAFNVVEDPDVRFWQQGFWSKDFREYRREIGETQDTYKALKSAALELKIPLDDVGKVAAEGGPQFDQLVAKLRESGDAGNRAADQLEHTRATVEHMARDAQGVDAGFAKLQDGLAQIAESGGDADKKLSGLNTALQGLGLMPENAQQAMLELAKEVDGLAESSQNMADKSDVLGDALVDQDGQIQGTGKNAQSLNDALTELSNSYKKAVVRGTDATEAYERMRPALERLQREYGLTDEQVQKLTNRYGMVPDVVSTLVKAEGADQAQQNIIAVSEMLKNIPTGQQVQIKAPTEEAIKQLESLGVAVERIPGSADVRVSATSDEARAQLGEIADMVATIGNKSYTVDMVLDTTPLEGSAREADQILAALHDMKPTPEADLIIDKLRSGKDISVGELNYLASLTPTPQADLANELANNKAQDTSNKLNELNGQTAKPDVKIEGIELAISSIGRVIDKLNALPLRKKVELVVNMASAAWGAMTGHAAGGRLPKTGPGTHETDGFIGVDALGKPLTRVDRGEWVINRRSSDKYDRELAAINAGTFPKQALKDGGKVDDDDSIGSIPTVSEVLDFVNGLPSRGQQASRPLTGAPYDRGGVDWGDCSGAVSGISRFAKGLAAFAGRFSTFTEEQALASMGFLPGLGDPATSLNVGWHNNVAAYGDGHTAVTIGGTNAEMGGAYGGGMVGGNVGADHPQFDHHAHTPLADSKEFEDSEITNTSVDGVTISSESGDRTISWGKAQETFDFLATAFGAKLYDNGGWLPHGGVAMNLSGSPEPILTAGNWAVIGQQADAINNLVAELRRFEGQFPGVVQGFERAITTLDATAAGLEALTPADGGRSVADTPTSLADISDDLTAAVSVAAGNAKANPTRYGLQLAGAVLPEVFGGLRDAERGLSDTRIAAKDGVEEIAEREKELAEAREALAKLDAEGGGYDKQTQRKLDDAQKAVDRAKSAKKPSAERIADAEEKLARAREDAESKLDEQQKKRAKDRDKAATQVEKAEKSLADTRTKTAQLVAQIGAGEISIAIEAAKAVYNLGKTIYETVKKVVDWIVDKINAVAAAQLAVGEQATGMLTKLAQAADEADKKLAELRMSAINAQIAYQQAMWGVTQANGAYTATQLKGIVEVANARAKATSDELASVRIVGTSVDDMWARTIAGLQSGTLTFGETVESVQAQVGEKLAREAEVHKAQADALKQNADSAVSLLEASKGAAKAMITAKSATALLNAQVGRLNAMSKMGDGGASTPQAMRLQRVTELLAEAADWTARDKKELKIEESRRYRAAAREARAEANKILREHFGNDPNYGRYQREINQVMSRAGAYGFSNSIEKAKKVIEAALKATSLGKAVRDLETQQVERNIADWEKTLAETQVEVANTAIDATYAPKEQQARGEQAAAAAQSEYFDAAAKYYRAGDDEVRKALGDFMEFSRRESTRLAESSGKQVTELEGIAQSARGIYDKLKNKPLGFDLPTAQALPPSKVPAAWSKVLAAALAEQILSPTSVGEVARRVVAQVDVPQVGTRYSTREDVEQARRERDEAVARALNEQLAAERARQLDLQLDRRLTNIERSVAQLPPLEIHLPGTVMDPVAVGHALKEQLASVSSRVTVLEGNNGRNYFKTRS